MGKHAITALLTEIKAGRKELVDDVFALLYAEIKNLAGYQLKQLQPGQTITPTVLAHECYIKVANNEDLQLNNKRHFLHYMGLSMRAYLVDSLRAKSTAKRQHVKSSQTLSDCVGDSQLNFRVMEMEQIFKRIEQIDEKLFEILQLKVLLGLTYREISETIDLSERQVIRRWQQAKALALAIHKESNSHG
ncbi:MAG: ECF-type sigma factor [Proteobacteria bacterium]|nr:ECF-type sigma factor [Pseudomonadota bacterium]